MSCSWKGKVVSYISKINSYLRYMLQFFRSDTEYFEYLSHVHRMFYRTSHARENYSIGLVFIKSFGKDYTLITEHTH